MQVVSSNLTLTLKLLFPTLWFCFLGVLSVGLFFVDLSQWEAYFSPMATRFLMLSFWASTAVIYYLIFAPIKWVALDQSHLYVSNFKTSYQYTLDSVAKVEENKFLFFHKVVIHFHQAGEFGESITFFASYHWLHYLQQHPKVLKQLLN